MAQDILLPPDPARVMEGLRDTGYSFNTAAADIIDNSIAAKATKIDITLNLDSTGNITVNFADNGCGMNEEELENAMRYGSNRRQDPSSLGKFGLGLKTASTAFCRCLSVISRGDDNTIRKVQWDLDYIANTGEWTLRALTPTEDEKELLEETCGEGTGTLVVWDKTDRLINSRGSVAKALKKTEAELEFHIALVYQRFLDKTDNRAANVEITLDGKSIEPWDPYCSDEENTTVLAQTSADVEIEDKHKNGTLFMRAVMIPRRDEFSSVAAADRARVVNDMQGFYIYRENRLIHYGDWMGMFTKEPHGTLLRTELSFNHELDDVFAIDIKKSRILLNDDIFDYIRNQFMPAPRRAADERYRKGTQKQVKDASKTAHDAANRSIDEKAKRLEESKVEIKNKDTGEVEIKNQNGTFRHKITIHTEGDRNKCRVIPMDGLDGGVLWNPTITGDGKHAVELNTQHPYYQKIYYPVLSENVMVTGMDALLWALSEAELSTYSEETKDQYEDMRYLVSRMLKKLIADLPEPDTEA